VLTACAGPAAVTQVRPEGRELVLWHSFEGALRDALLTQVDEFNATNPWRIVVVPEFHGDAQQLGTELQAAVKAGTAPDLVIRNPSDVWALGDAMVPIQTYVDDKRFGLTPNDLKDVYPAMLDMARDPKNKTLLSFPLGGEGVVLVYNADRLTTQNYFTPPTSWPLFKEICEATTRDTTGDSRTDVFGFGFDPRADFATAWLNSRGGSILSDDGTHTIFNSDEGVRTLATLQDTAKSGCFLRSGDESLRDFARGKVAMIFARTTQLPEIFDAVEASGGFRWNVSPVPYGRRNPTLTISGPAWVMLKSTPDKQLAAWLFIRWFAETPQAVRWSQLTGLLPLRRSAGLGLADEFATNAGLKVAFDLLSVARAQPDVRQWDAIAELLIHAVIASVEGNDPTQLLNEAAQAADNLLNQ
jgi:multiple sugar transport system substrate-binding protein/sn-glycerol 3-phosphate transport system substrate-binding protein